MSIAMTSDVLLGRTPGVALPRIVASEGHELVDETGMRYLDGISGAYAAILGYSLGSVVDTMSAVAARVPYVHNARFDTPESIALAELLSDAAGKKGYRVHFSVSGADGVEAAFRMAIASGNACRDLSRHALASLRYSYHGSTGFALSATGHVGARGTYAKYLKKVRRLDLMRWVRIGQSYEAEWATNETAIERAIGDQTAAVIVEPMLGNAAGCVEIPAPTLSAIASICERKDIVLIADEVSVGTWRTDGVSLSHANGIEPDFIVLGKALTAGLFPLSAVLVSPRAAARLDDNVNLLGHTHGAHPVGCAIALNVVRQVMEPAFQSHMLQLKVHFEERLRSFKQLPRVSSVRGRGLMYSVCLQSMDNEVAPSALSARLYSACLSRGLLVMPGTVLTDNGARVSDHITLAPAFNMKTETLDDIAERLGDALLEL